MIHSAQRTIQLRRYALVEGTYDDFLAWFQTTIPAVREGAGFTIEFAYGLRESNEFVWAVSAEGSPDDFLEIETVYMASDARAAAFDGVPQRVASHDIRFVEDVVL